MFEESFLALRTFSRDWSLEVLYSLTNLLVQLRQDSYGDGTAGCGFKAAEIVVSR